MEALIITHYCYECNKESEVSVTGRKVKCPYCNVENDFWLDDESPPLNHR